MTTYSARPTRRFNLREHRSTQESERPLKITRFAPSTTGPAHLGTLYAGLIAWLFARSQNGRVILRLENLDRQRSKEKYLEEMLEILDRCGLDFDEVQRQDERLKNYEAALHKLAQQGRVYVCSCSRKRLKALNRPTPEGGFAYDNHCRKRRWMGETYEGSLRLMLDDTPTTFTDANQGKRTLDVSKTFGDPVIVRRDGAVAYHFASTIDDDVSAVTDVVRGRDLFWSSPPQAAIREILGLRLPSYHHHPLLLESQSKKLAKLHGSLPVRSILEHQSAEELIGTLAWLAGLSPPSQAMHPGDLIDNFHWSALPQHDWLVDWEPPTVRRSAIAWPSASITS